MSRPVVPPTVALLGALVLATLVALPSPPAAAALPRKQTLEHDGRTRTFLLKVPRPAKHPGKRPLVLVLHGGGGTARGAMNQDRRRMNQLADQHGFLVAYPQGVERSWNEGRGETKAHQLGVDDLGFLTALVEHLVATRPVNAAQVFATGISNGGFMSVRLACSRPAHFRGVAAVTAQVATAWADQCTGPAPVSLLLVNGTADPLVPYAGGPVQVLGKTRGEVLPTDVVIAGWRAKLGCSEATETTALPDPVADGISATRTVWHHCAGGAKVGLIRVEGGGHAWPGGRQVLPKKLIGPVAQDFNASDEIAAFFASVL